MDVKRLLSSGNLDFSMESIDLQSDAFKNSLTALYTDVIGKTRQQIFDSDFETKLVKVIKQYSGIEMKIYMGSVKNASEDICWAVSLPPPTVNNVVTMKNNGFAVALGRIVKMKFDMKKGKVTQGAEAFNPYLCIPTIELEKKWVEPAEATAVTLHEVGHAFYMLAFTAKFISSNIAMHEISRSIKGISSADERAAIIRRSTDENDLKGIDAKELGKLTDPTAISVVLSNKLMDEFRSAIDTSQHDRGMFEILADMYASRFGAGVDIVKFLHKVYPKDYKGFNPYASWLSTTVTLFSILTILASQFTASLATGGIFWILGASVILGLLGAEPGGVHYLYDTIDDRMTRIRHQASLHMRDKNITKLQYVKIKTDLEVLDKIISERPREETFERYLSQMFSDVRKRKSDAEIQMDLEKLAHNTLYERSADLRYA